MIGFINRHKVVKWTDSDLLKFGDFLQNKGLDFGSTVYKSEILEILEIKDGSLV